MKDFTSFYRTFRISRWILNRAPFDSETAHDFRFKWFEWVLSESWRLRIFQFVILSVRRYRLYLFGLRDISYSDIIFVQKDSRLDKNIFRAEHSVRIYPNGLISKTHFCSGNFDPNNELAPHLLDSSPNEAKRWIVFSSIQNFTWEFWFKRRGWWWYLHLGWKFFGYVSISDKITTKRTTFSRVIQLSISMIDAWQRREAKEF